MNGKGAESTLDRHSRALVRELTPDSSELVWPAVCGFANLLALQDDLARRFAAALHQSPAVALQARTSPIISPQPGTLSLAAYRSVAEANDLYLAGRYREAIERMQSSVKRNDGYADAWALLGKSYAPRAGRTLDSGARSEFHREALRTSRRAAELEPTLYEAQVSLALAYRALEQFEAARKAAQQAIDLNPRPRRRL